jgi:hypothetical protein
VASTLVTGCDVDLTCAETATCPPSGSDAQPETGDLDGGGLNDADAGDADVGAADGRTDRTTDDARDVSRDSDGSTRPDTFWPDGRADADRSVDVARDGVTTDDTSIPIDAPYCDLDAGRSPTENPCIVSERYGVFVSPEGSDATGAGTRGAPFRTINRGLQAARTETRRVYVCDNGAGFTEPVTVDATFDGLSMYGGFECAGWTLAANARTAVHPAAGPALFVADLTRGVTVEGFDLRAADAAPGASSIAVHVQSSAAVVLRRTRLLAGNGGAGQSGTDGAPGANGEAPGPAQRGRSASCVPPILSQAGGAAVAASCGSKGGNGGACDTTLGSLPGENGAPMVGVDPPNVANGATHWLADRSGRPGSRGTAGAPGAANSKAGSFSATGYTLAGPGDDGVDGQAAQGGGGGSGGEADPSNWCIGASGGAGGMGGCGGLHGAGGGAGGASVALLSWASAITLDQCEVVSADGGVGGNGGQGGLGGPGASGAEGGDGVLDPDAGQSLIGAGAGGPGGNGGPGGGGAGGNGGPTYAIVYSGTRPSQTGGTTIARGSGGAPGIGGTTPIVTLPDGGVGDGGGSEGGVQEGGIREGGIAEGGKPDGGAVRAADGLPGEAAYELLIP